MENLGNIGLWGKALVILTVAGAALIVYFVPAIVASLRQHRNSTGVFLVNLLLGWTLLGWVAALVWAVYREREPSVSRQFVAKTIQ